MIALIDYQAGNLFSVSKAVQALGADIRITARREEILGADKVIFPGVGSFGQAMETLKQQDLVQTIRDVIDRGTPFLGICLGLQLLFESSEESDGIGGLNILKGNVRRFSHNLKVPHLGWNEVHQVRSSPLWQALPDQSYFYFAHSYYIDPVDRSIVTGESEYGGRCAVAVHRDHIYGVQFHPEKSQKWGLHVLNNFIQHKGL